MCADQLINIPILSYPILSYYLEGGHACAGCDDGVLGREGPDNLVHQETLTRPSSTSEEHILTSSHLPRQDNLGMHLALDNWLAVFFNFSRDEGRMLNMGCTK